MKTAVMAAVAAGLAWGTAAFGATDEEVVADFLENFRMLAAVPRPSHHEAAIADRLQAWAEERGFEVKRNAADDLIFDVPATEGLEGLPLVALQAHMDMVCVGAEGKAYDPLADPIGLVLDEEAGTLRADGTSLGADDGAGVAMIMGIAKGLMAHGPLRVVFTTDEEDSMGGVLALGKEDVAGVKYLVNVDGEQSDAVIVSSAADATIVATAEARMEPAKEGTETLEISVSGGRGGHSGMEIGEGRCNAIKALGGALFWMSGSAPFELASFEGGTADNAIPAKARAVVVVNKGTRKNVERFLEWIEAGLKERYAGKDDGVTLAVAEAEPVAEVFAAEQWKNILEYVLGSMDGVNTMSAEVEGLVESSCNLGIISAGPGGVEIRQMPRSSVGARLEEIVAHQRFVGEGSGMSVEVTPGSKPWPVKADNALAAKVREAYRELNGEEMKVVAIHAGLECGAFAELSEELDMVSVGPDLKDVHSPGETLFLKSVPKTWRLLEKELAEVE